MPNGNELKWPEVLSLAGLNAAIVISWIAYHEYQPVLIERFNFSDLAGFLILAKAIILVIIPPFAGWLADLILRRNGKYFTMFTVGIGSTAMVFMVVATIIGAGQLSPVRDFLPFMIVIWLVAMNLFISPANSMIEAFAPAQKLPVVMGVLFLTTEMLYALEPVIINLIHFFGDTITFVVGGILIAGTGILFQRVSSNEVITRRKEMMSSTVKSGTGLSAFIAIVIVALGLGLCKAFLVEILPGYLDSNYILISGRAEMISFGLLGISAILGFSVSGVVARNSLTSSIILGFILLLVGAIVMLSNMGLVPTLAGATLIAVAFSLINISGLPFALGNLSIRNVTYGVGVYIGASEIFTGIAENL